MAEYIELVRRLRAVKSRSKGELLREAADAIERLRAEREQTTAQLLFLLWKSWSGSVEEDPAKLWCDGMAGCIDGEGTITCDEERVKVCILRYIRRTL